MDFQLLASMEEAKTVVFELSSDKTCEESSDKTCEELDHGYVRS